MSGVPQPGDVNAQTLFRALYGAGAPSPAKPAAAPATATSSPADVRGNPGGFTLTSNYAAITAAGADPASSGALKTTLGS